MTTQNPSRERKNGGWYGRFKWENSQTFEFY